MEPSEAYEVVHCVPAPSLPYSQPGSCYTLIRLPDDDPTAGTNVQTSPVFKLLKCQVWVIYASCLFAVSCTFSCTMKYLVRDCDPNTGEPDDDGYDDEYVVCNRKCVTLFIFALQL